MTLEIKNLNVKIEGKEILKGINLKLEKGKVYALMGPNGSGKSTLANVLAGNPRHEVSGEILLNSKNIENLSPEKRAKEGLFMSFQNPVEVQGVKISDFLRTTYNSIKENKISVLSFKKKLREQCELLGLDNEFASRYLNQGFSGGEKKKSEILQMFVLDPEVIILDETDSGLDIDALSTIAKGINKFRNKDKIILIISHYSRIFNQIKPDETIIIKNRKISKTGSEELVNEIEERGYKNF